MQFWRLGCVTALYSSKKKRKTPFIRDILTLESWAYIETIKLKLIFLFFTIEDYNYYYSAEKISFGNNRGGENINFFLSITSIEDEKKYINSIYWYYIIVSYKLNLFIFFKLFQVNGNF